MFAFWKHSALAFLKWSDFLSRRLSLWLVRWDGLWCSLLTIYSARQESSLLASIPLTAYLRVFDLELSRFVSKDIVTWQGGKRGASKWTHFILDIGCATFVLFHFKSISVVVPPSQSRPLNTWSEGASSREDWRWRVSSGREGNFLVDL